MFAMSGVGWFGLGIVGFIRRTSAATAVPYRSPTRSDGLPYH